MEKKKAKIIIFQKHEIDVLYDKNANIEKIKKDLLKEGYKVQYHIIAEEEDQQSNIFFTKKLVIER